MGEAVPAAGTADPRRLNSLRRLGYRLLPGDSFSYLLHLRPREWPIVAAHTIFGFLLAAVARPEALLRIGDALAGTLLFVLLLNGGTLAINSAFDRDEGDIGYLDAPPPPPRHLLTFGLVLMGAGQIVALLVLPRAFALVYGACLVLSVLYSVPPFRWKSVAGLDLAINAVGFGTLTPLAGWALSGIPLPAWGWWVLVGFGLLFAALYPLTQLYQLDEDRARGDRTLALRLGTPRALSLSAVTMVGAFGIFGVGLRVGAAGASGILVVLPFWAWGMLLWRWTREHRSMSAAQHKEGMYRALKAWALTNVTLLLAFAL